MRYIVHSETPPPSIVAAHRAEPHPLNPRQAWDDFDSRELREHLWELQSGLCAYCERALKLGPGTSSIDHIVPKTANPQVTFQYTNLVLCCVDQNTCNLHKKGQHFAGCDATGRWTQGFIAPTQPRCETSFTYGRDGSIHPSVQADEPDARSRMEQAAMNAVIAAEQARGCRVVDVSAQKCGWDITSYPPSTDGKITDSRHIEVKGRIQGASTVTVTRNEIFASWNQGAKYHLAIVLVAEDDSIEGPHYVSHPFKEEPGWGVSSVNYDLKALVKLAQPTEVGSR